MVVSTFADRPLEEIAKAATRPLWHATYVMRDRGRTRELLHRAEAAGCEAICVPVDSPVVGARDREHRTYRFPRDPISFLDYPADYWRYPTTWKDIDWVRSQTGLPLVLKGILDPEGAGSGHPCRGRRDLRLQPRRAEPGHPPGHDRGPPRGRREGLRRVPIIVDGGVRRGTDVLKALALGATAVAIGRPYLYALAVSGADGVRGAVNVLRNELEMAMALTGRPTIAGIDRSLILPASWSPKA